MNKYHINPRGNRHFGANKRKNHALTIKQHYFAKQQQNDYYNG